MEAVTGEPWQHVVRARVLRPAGADDLVLPPRDGDPVRAAPGAAGSMRGPAPDVARMLDALLSGRVVGPGGLRTMLHPLRRSPDPALRYGRGLITYDLPDGTRWIGHSGGTSEGRAVAVWMPSTRVTVAVALRGAASVEAAASLIAEAL
jgi:D-alanyl-D-alanine carboxypeptidase